MSDYGIQCWSEPPDYRAIYTFCHEGEIIARPMEELQQISGATVIGGEDMITSWMGQSRWREKMPRVVFLTRFAKRYCGWERFYFTCQSKSGHTSPSGKSPTPPQDSGKTSFPSD